MKVLNFRLTKLESFELSANIVVKLESFELSVNIVVLMQGTVVLVFQPAEEGGGGAKKMLDEGSIEDVEAIFATHVLSELPIGTVSSKAGTVLAASGRFEAAISGQGGHAAIPHHAIDPILAAANIVISLQHLVSREADPFDSQVLHHLHLLFRIPVVCWMVSLDMRKFPCSRIRQHFIVDL